MRCPWPRASVPSRHSARTDRTHRSAKALARGARHGVRCTRLLPGGRPRRTVRTTSSPELEKASLLIRDPPSMARFLTCWVTDEESGWVVTPLQNPNDLEITPGAVFVESSTARPRPDACPKGPSAPRPSTRRTRTPSSSRRVPALAKIRESQRRGPLPRCARQG